MQEVIVQNFRAKPDTAMRHADDLDLDEYRAAIAVTRIVLGPKARVQAPPNLVDLAECRALLEAGVDDWGGVSPLTPDHVNPERPWPSLERLRDLTAECGFELAARLTVHPEYVRAGEPWLDPRVSGHVAALATDDGLARPGVRPVGPAVAGAGRRLRVASAAPTCSRPSTPRAAPTTGAPTSPTSTATGTSVQDAADAGSTAAALAPRPPTDGSPR